MIPGEPLTPCARACGAGKSRQGTDDAARTPPATRERRSRRSGWRSLAMSSRVRLLAVCATGLALCYLAIAALPDLKGSAAYLALHAAAFVFYLPAVIAVVRGSGGAPESTREHFTVIVAAALFRIILLPTTPTLSDDIYRYLWEGGLQVEGVNPYLHAPSDPELIPYRNHLYERINHKELPAIYPPAMHWVFALGAFWGPSPLVMKSLFVAADMALVLALGALLHALGWPAARCLIYAWNPLAVVEVAGSGHNDAVALLLLVLSTLAVIRRRSAVSAGALGLSALLKLFPMSLLPLFARRLRPSHLLIPPALMTVGYLPYLAAGRNLFVSARQYAERWRGNDSIFAVMVWLADRSGIEPLLKDWCDTHGINSLYSQPHLLAREAGVLIALTALGWLTLRQWRSGEEPSRAIFLFSGLVLILQPALHPWYLLWILPWLCLYTSPAWLLLTGLIPLSYMDAAWVRWVEYLP